RALKRIQKRDRKNGGRKNPDLTHTHHNVPIHLSYLHQCPSRQGDLRTGAVEFQQGRLGRPPDQGGPSAIDGLSHDQASTDVAISPDDLLRFLDTVTATGPTIGPPPAFPSLSPSVSTSLSAPSVHALSSTFDSSLHTDDALELLAHSDSPVKEQVVPLISSAFGAPAKAFDAGDIFLPFDLDPLSASLSSASTDLFAFPLFEPSSASFPSSTLPSDPLVFDAALDSPLGLGNGSSLSDFLASPMFSLPPSAAPSTTFSELPLPSPSAELTASTFSFFPPPHSSASLSFHSNTPTTALLPPLPSCSMSPTPSLDHTCVAPPRRTSSKPVPTGFADTSTPLLAMDAPIQARNSVIPSATSRKRKTAAAEKALAKRRKEAEAKASPPLAVEGVVELPADIVAAVERKRLQNTLSARKSRARKQARVQELEAENEALRKRVEDLERMLGIVGRAA
ncbi:hypothetical protein JCM11641_007415, partial [Rhodosporidiobolus odoratus]